MALTGAQIWVTHNHTGVLICPLVIPIGYTIGLTWVIEYLCTTRLEKHQIPNQITNFSKTVLEHKKKRGIILAFSIFVIKNI